MYEHKYVKINNPQEIKKYSYKELLALCESIRNDIIESTSINGGHLSSNLGSVESIIAYYRIFNAESDKILFDVGHQCYTHKILTGRSLEKLRCKNGIEGFPKRSESKYDCFEGGHSSNSISNALGMALARDANGETYDIVAYIGDGSISNGLAFEALNDIQLAKHKIIIILNDNGMSISQNVGKTSQIFSKISSANLYNSGRKFMNKHKNNVLLCSLYNIMFSFKNFIKKILIHNNLFTDFGISYYGVVDGHNIKKLEKAFKKAQKNTKTTLVHIKTLKGNGYFYTQNDEIGIYHGVSPFNITTGNKKISEDLYCHFFGKLALETLEKDKKAFLLCPGTLVSLNLGSKAKQFNNRIIDFGINEEHCFSVAAGLALSGYHPIISIYSTFMQRAFDELSHDIARENLDVTLLIDRVGVVGKDGDTHNGVFDEAFLMNTPNCVVCMPSNINQANSLYDLSFKNHGLFAIRMEKTPIYNTYIESDKNLEFGKWIFSTENNSKTLIISYGPIINSIINFKTENNIKVDVVNAIFQKPFDYELIKQIIDKKYSKIIIYNVYATEIGFNNKLIAELINNGFKEKIVSMCLNDTFIKTQSTTQALEEQHLSVKDLFSKI